jgi:hypothetical protein
MFSSSGFFPLSQRQALWRTVQPGRYHYQITADALVRVFLSAFVWRLSGLREIVERLGRLLGTGNFSSLCPALARPSSLRFVAGLFESLQDRRHAVGQGLIAIDSMAVTLPASQRHRCRKYNDKTVGGGVLWAFMIHTRRGSCPVRVLKTMAGAWGDTAQMAGVELSTRGPIYLMDRGFYALKLIEQWLCQRVRFIVRARGDAVYERLKTLSAPRGYGKAGRIEMDAWVRLGSVNAKVHPRARMIRARVGEQLLVLVTGLRHLSAERLLDAYRQRERIEQFHRLVKEVVGLAHLYSFSQSGIEFLLYTAVLLAMLLVLGEAQGETITVLRRTLRNLRRRIGLGQLWKRNTFLTKRAKDHRKNH